MAGIINNHNAWDLKTGVNKANYQKSKFPRKVQDGP